MANERPTKGATRSEMITWKTVALNVLHSCSSCLMWPSESGIAVEKFLNALFALATNQEEEEEKEAPVDVEQTPLSPTVETESDESQLLMERMLKHLVVTVLPMIENQLLQLQTIWVLAQFVRAPDQQRILLGLLLQRLNKEKKMETDLDPIFAKYEQVSSVLAGSWLQLAGADVMFCELGVMTCDDSL